MLVGVCSVNDMTRKDYVFLITLTIDAPKKTTKISLLVNVKYQIYSSKGKHHLNRVLGFSRGRLWGLGSGN